MRKITKRRNNPAAIDWIAALVLSILLIIVVLLELVYSGPDTTRLETGLFNILEVLLSIGFSWFLARAVTKREFEDSLKRFAISAYRRIRDIDRLVSRIQAEISKMRANYPGERMHELDIVRIMAEDIGDTVDSSIADWAEVIGDELEKEQELKDLESRYAQARLMTIGEGTALADDETELSELREEISRLRSEIPYMLGYDVKPITEYEPPEAIIEVLSAELEEYGEITFQARGYVETYTSDWDGLSLGDRLYLHPSYATHSFEFIVLRANIPGDNFQALGQVVNPYAHLGMSEVEFNMALRNVMEPSIRFLDEGTQAAPVEFIGPAANKINRFNIRFSLSNTH